ncbi:hypothetical protein MRX96_038602 [Rhipicephalus microplus]
MMNGEGPSVPITTLAGIQSITELLLELPLPSALPGAGPARSLLPAAQAEEARRALASDARLLPPTVGCFGPSQHRPRGAQGWRGRCPAAPRLLPTLATVGGTRTVQGATSLAAAAAAELQPRSAVLACRRSGWEPRLLSAHPVHSAPTAARPLGGWHPGWDTLLAPSAQAAVKPKLLL